MPQRLLLIQIFLKFWSLMTLQVQNQLKLQTYSTISLHLFLLKLRKVSNIPINTFLIFLKRDLTTPVFFKSKNLFFYMIFTNFVIH